MPADSAIAAESLRPSSRVLVAAWWVAVGAAVAVRLWNAFAGPLMWGYDAPGHIAYVFYLDRYTAIPWAHQGWGYFHPPLHYLFGWGLAQFGSAELLLRGLALIGSAASLAIAALAASVARAVNPARPVLALFAFIAVAFLPVHLYTSPMSGNELTCAAFGAAALATLIANEGRARPRLARDVLAGCFVALALLSKFSGATVLAGCVAVILLRPLVSGGGRDAFASAVRRAIVLAAVVGVLAGPYYARNFARYGTPFRMNRDFALTAEVEEAQAPGSRSWRDLVSLSPRLLSDPRPGAAHLLHSIWGSAYVNAWSDARALWNRLPEPDAERLRRARVAMVRLGLLPTALAILGAMAAIGDIRRGRRVGSYLPLLVFAGLALFAFAVFSLRVPRISALKASYLMGLSLPYGVFVARGVEALAHGRGRALAIVGCIAVVAPAVAAAAIYRVGGVHPLRNHGRGLGAVQLLARDTAAARAFYRGRLASAPDSSVWKQGLAAVELADGAAPRARDLYREVLKQHRNDPQLTARLGVAEALSGNLEEARLRFDRALELAGGASAFANRGAVSAELGDLAAAVSDLERALENDPDFAVAAHNLAVVHERAGRKDAAASARSRWLRATVEPPSGYPYGVGVGLLEPGARPLLWLGEGGLRLAEAPFDSGP
jgi:tetratricopeptide (TPR) repeat protein